ncbi:MAG TPA: Ig-like domain-containing protein [Candidatus Brocadiia bacterium]|nr:Ig-like domain-containing protein [Candidatus Brocadiia bacterium]
MKTRKQSVKVNAPEVLEPRIMLGGWATLTVDDEVLFSVPTQATMVLADNETLGVLYEGENPGEILFGQHDATTLETLQAISVPGVVVGPTHIEGDDDGNYVMQAVSTADGSPQLVIVESNGDVDIMPLAVGASWRVAGHGVIGVWSNSPGGVVFQAFDLDANSLGTVVVAGKTLAGGLDERDSDNNGNFLAEVAQNGGGPNQLVAIKTDGGVGFIGSLDLPSGDLYDWDLSDDGSLGLLREKTFEPVEIVPDEDLLPGGVLPPDWRDLIPEEFQDLFPDDLTAIDGVQLLTYDVTALAAGETAQAPGPGFEMPAGGSTIIADDFGHYIIDVVFEDQTVVLLFNPTGESRTFMGQEVGFLEFNAEDLDTDFDVSGVMALPEGWNMGDNPVFKVIDGVMTTGYHFELPEIFEGEFDLMDLSTDIEVTVGGGVPDWERMEDGDIHVNLPSTGVFVMADDQTLGGFFRGDDYVNEAVFARWDIMTMERLATVVVPGVLQGPDRLEGDDAGNYVAEALTVADGSSVLVIVENDNSVDILPISAGASWRLSGNGIIGVWTDTPGGVAFEAFDLDGNSLGTTLVPNMALAGGLDERDLDDQGFFAAEMVSTVVVGAPAQIVAISATGGVAVDGTLVMPTGVRYDWNLSDNGTLGLIQEVPNGLRFETYDISDLAGGPTSDFEETDLSMPEGGSIVVADDWGNFAVDIVVDGITVIGILNEGGVITSFGEQPIDATLTINGETIFTIDTTINLVGGLPIPTGMNFANNSAFEIVDLLTSTGWGFDVDMEEGTYTLDFLISDTILDWLGIPEEVKDIEVRVTFVRANIAPIPVNQFVTTDEDVSIDIILSAVDPDGDPIAYNIAELPEHGTLVGPIQDGDGNWVVTYTPGAEFSGNDVFTFIAEDGRDLGNFGTVDITVNNINDAPTTNDSPFNVTAEGIPLVLTVDGFDVEDDSLTFQVLSQPGHGVASMSGANEVIYTPNTRFIGTDTFQVIAFDGTTYGAAGTVTVNVGRAVQESSGVLNDYLLQFGSVLEGATTSQTFTITNSGTRAFSLGAITTSNPAYTFSVDDVNLSVGDVATITVTFNPALAGAYNGTIEIDTDLRGDNTYVLNLNGSADAPPPPNYVLVGATVIYGNTVWIIDKDGDNGDMTKTDIRGDYGPGYNPYDPKNEVILLPYDPSAHEYRGVIAILRGDFTGLGLIVDGNLTYVGCVGSGVQGVSAVVANGNIGKAALTQNLDGINLNGAVFDYPTPYSGTYALRADIDMDGSVDDLTGALAVQGNIMSLSSYKHISGDVVAQTGAKYIISGLSGYGDLTGDVRLLGTGANLFVAYSMGNMGGATSNMTMDGRADFVIAVSGEVRGSYYAKEGFGWIGSVYNNVRSSIMTGDASAVSGSLYAGKAFMGSFDSDGTLDLFYAANTQKSGSARPTIIANRGIKTVRVLDKMIATDIGVGVRAVPDPDKAVSIGTVIVGQKIESSNILAGVWNDPGMVSPFASDGETPLAKPAPAFDGTAKVGVVYVGNQLGTAGAVNWSIAAQQYDVLRVGREVYFGIDIIINNVEVKGGI